MRGAREVSDVDPAPAPSTGVTLDLDRALATLPEDMRTCIVLSYHEGMTHKEIADVMEIPLGTTKSHITRGTKRLREILSAYRDESNANAKQS